jgi:jumonji domain-containing protein 7
MPLSEDRVDEAAKTLAIESRSLLGLPLDPSGSDWVQRLHNPPNALQFSRMVAKHQPLLIEKCVEERGCRHKWKGSEYLIDAMGQRKVEVTLTPNGRADDIHTTADGKDVFVLPDTVHMCVHLFNLMCSKIESDICSTFWLPAQ